MATLGDAAPSNIDVVFKQAKRLNRRFVLRSPTITGKAGNFDYYYPTSQQARARDSVPDTATHAQLPVAPDDRRLFLRLKTSENKKCYNRLSDKKKSYLICGSEGYFYEYMLLTPVGELPGHIDWNELPAPVVHPAVQRIQPAASPTNSDRSNTSVPSVSPHAESIVRRMMAATTEIRANVARRENAELGDQQEQDWMHRRRPSVEDEVQHEILADVVALQEDTDRVETPPSVETPRAPTPPPRAITPHAATPPPRVITPFFPPPIRPASPLAQRVTWLHENEPGSPTEPVAANILPRNLEPIVIINPVPISQPDISSASQRTVRPTAPPRQSGEERLNAAQILISQLRAGTAPLPVVETRRARQTSVAREARPDSEIRATQELFTELAEEHGSSQDSRESRSALEVIDEWLDEERVEEESFWPRAVPPSEVFGSKKVERVGRLLGQIDTVQASIKRHEMMLADGRPQVVPKGPVIQFPLMNCADVATMTEQFNEFLLLAAFQMSQTVIDHEREIEADLLAELDNLIGNYNFNKEELRTILTIRLARTRKLKEYKAPTSPVPVRFYDEPIEGETSFRPCDDAKTINTAGFRQPAKAATTEPAPAKKKTQKKKKAKKAPAQPAQTNAVPLSSSSRQGNGQKPRAAPAANRPRTEQEVKAALQRRPKGRYGGEPIWKQKSNAAPKQQQQPRQQAPTQPPRHVPRQQPRQEPRHVPRPDPRHQQQVSHWDLPRNRELLERLSRFNPETTRRNDRAGLDAPAQDQERREEGRHRSYADVARTVNGRAYRPSGYGRK
jgi:pyruvate/2-oxoglutarate dehydrogenase complex dihydrolipoamide acyltransferase (E2) component